jgi:cell division protein FtsI/penicillin-binding protein 2
MALRVEHELHQRRFSRNVGLGLVLAAFVALVFALTVVKVTQGDRMHANDGKKNTGVVVQPSTGGSQP